jgi:predicted ATPase
MFTKGYAASETKASLEQSRILIERVEALGEPSEDPLVLFSVLYGFWVASRVALDGDAMCGLAAQFVALATKTRASVALTNGHRVMGISLVLTGGISEGRAHLDQAIALYDPAEHRPLAMRFGADVGVSILSYRSIALWLLGEPEAALADTNHALKVARAIGQAATLMLACLHAPLTHILCGNHAAANSEIKELISLADEKGALSWKSLGTLVRGCLLALTGNASDAVQMITAASAAYRSTGATWFAPTYLSLLARAYADIGQFDDAGSCIGEAITAAETTKETWWEAEIHRIAGEIALLSPERDATKAQAHFERALEIARAQQARSWQLRAAASLARLWRDSGRRVEAHDLLAPVYGWFTEGFDTLDLKQAKALLKELAS